MSSSASYTNFSQFPPDAEIHHLRGENASLKMENQKLISTSAVLYQEIEDAKVIIGQKEEEIAQKDKKLKESEEGLRQSILKARAQNNQHYLDMQELGFKNEAALKKMQTQLDEKDKELEKEKNTVRTWVSLGRHAVEERIAKDKEIAQLKAENLKLKTEKTICKEMGVDIDLLSSSGTSAPPVATNSAPIVGSEEDENEGPWAFTLPDEHQLPTPVDASPDFDPTDAAVLRIGDKHYVVPISWYEGAEEADLDNEVELLKVFIGMVNNPVYPEEDGGEITGTFVSKE